MHSTNFSGTKNKFMTVRNDKIVSTAFIFNSIAIK